MTPLNSDLLDKILNEPKKLSPAQRRAVTCDRMHIRIIAGAGAGKTETLTRKIVYLLLVKGVDPSAIVAFTFTEKAAQGMKSRVYERVRHLGGEEICARLGEMFIGTIHGYCNRLLEENFGYGDYGVLDEKQEMAYLMHVGWSLGLGASGYYATNCEEFLNSLNVAYGEMIPAKTLEKKAGDFYQKKCHYEASLEQHKRLTFNRMVQLAVEKLQTQPEVTDHVEYLIVDEYQDINRAQEKLIQLIGKGGGIFIVGDPRQTIYQWRGSDERCFDEFAQNYAETATIRITENRRSTKAVITAANGFSDTFEVHRYDHMDVMRTEAGGIYLAEMDNNVAEVEWIANHIQALVKKGSCAYKDIALLFRSVTTSAPVFIDVFRERDIPFVVGGKVGLFRRLEILGMGKMFAWLWDDGFWQSDRYSSESRIYGDELFEEAVLNWNDGIPELALDGEGRERLVRWKETVLSSSYDNFTQVFAALLVLLGYHRLDPDDPRHAVIMANMGRFNTLLTDYETAIMLGGRKRRNWQSDLKGLCWYLNAYASSKYEEQAGDDVCGVDAVQLMTIHQSKGLEWPLVFIPALVNGRFPSSLAGRQRHWLLPRDLFAVEKYEGDTESERKLMYVAMTRAKDVAAVSYFTHMNGRKKGRSDFVDDVAELPGVVPLTQEENLPDYAYVVGGRSEELQTFTAGEIVDYGKCPYFYRLRHLWGYQPGISDYLGYGRALHFCLRETADLMKNEEMPPMTAVATAMEEHFFMPFVTEGRMEKIKDAAKKHLMKFARKYHEDMLRIREVESRIEFPIQNAIVTGKVDVILHDGEDAIEVRDYKTSDTATMPEDVALQVRLYSRGLTSIGETVTRGSVAYLEEAEVDDVDVSEDAIAGTVAHVEESIANILAGKFLACPGDSCERCDYGDICRWKA